MSTAIDKTYPPGLYLVTGIATMVTGPLVGKAADAFGKLQHFEVAGYRLCRGGERATGCIFADEG